MSWYRIEGNMPQHEKYVPLSDSAFRLAITAGAWCASVMTDGRLPKKVIAGLTRAPAGKKLDESVAELVDARIWDRIEGDDSAFNVHDFLDWNMSRAQWKAKKDAGSAGGKAKAAAKTKQPLKQKASKRLAPASDVLEQKPSTSSSVPLADSDSDSDYEDRSEKRSGDLPRLPDGKPTGKSDHQSLIDHYHDKFLAIRGGKPVIGGREAKDAKKLLDSVGRDLSKAIAILDNALNDEYWGPRVTIAEIAANPSKFICSKLPMAKTSCPDSLQFTEKHRGLAKRCSIDINLAWTKFKANSKSSDRKAVDWSAAFEASLAEAVDRIERAAAYRANGPDTQRGPVAAQQTAFRQSAATHAAPLVPETRHEASSPDLPKRRDVTSLLEGIG